MTSQSPFPKPYGPPVIPVPVPGPAPASVPAPAPVPVTGTPQARPNRLPDIFPPPQRPVIPMGRLRFSSFRAIAALMLREMATEHGRSPGGYIWAVLEPALGIGLLTAIFSIAFFSPPLGVNFPIFYATGILPFSVFTDISTKSATALMFSRALLTYPAVTFLDAVIARVAVNALTQGLVCSAVICGILLVFETRTFPDVPVILGALAMAVALGVGVGLVNCVLFVKIPLWQKLWALIARPLFLLSCVFHLFDAVPRPFRDYLWWNPLVHIIGQMRRGFFPGYDAAYVSLVYVWLLALGLTLIGLLFLRRYHRDLLNA